MVSEPLSSTEKQILEAAKKIFISKGLAGARMQDIADEAGINKALLHYYFRSKEKLFDRIFEEALVTFFPQIFRVVNAPMPLLEKIDRFVVEYITLLVDHPHIPLFILHELSQNPDRMVKKILSLHQGPLPEIFLRQLQEEMASGRIRTMSPVQFLINMLALCVFPFAGKPMIQGLLGLDELQYRLMLEQRKTELPRILRAMLEPENKIS
ncbi:MAG: TetR/AcrR family transcriptional regulator [Chitinophagaceae bacterium]